MPGLKSMLSQRQHRAPSQVDNDFLFIKCFTCDFILPLVTFKVHKISFAVEEKEA